MQNNFVCLFDDKIFENILSYSLDDNEQGCCILSCSFTDETNYIIVLGQCMCMMRRLNLGKDEFWYFPSKMGNRNLLVKRRQRVLYSMSMHFMENCLHQSIKILSCKNG
jgi:hypothetical protein